VSGEKMKILFQKSQLENSMLSEIWTLSEIDGDGAFSPEEFLIAIHLIMTIVKSQGAIPCPKSLPNSLFTSARRIASNMNVPTTTDNNLPVNIPTELVQLLETLNAPIPEIPISELTSKYGITDLIPVYNSSDLISKVESQINNVDMARNVLQQSEPEFKGLTLRVEKENAIKDSLIDKHRFMESQIKICDSQKRELLKLYNDFSNQVDETERESRQVEQEKNRILEEITRIQNEINNPNFDTSNLQNQRNQIAHEHMQIKNEYQQDAIEHKRLISEIEILKRDFENFKIDTNWDDYGFKENLEDF